MLRLYFWGCLFQVSVLKLLLLLFSEQVTRHYIYLLIAHIYSQGKPYLRRSHSSTNSALRRGSWWACDSSRPPSKSNRTVSNYYWIKFICSKSCKTMKLHNLRNWFKSANPIPSAHALYLKYVNCHCKLGHNEHLLLLVAPWARIWFPEVN